MIVSGTVKAPRVAQTQATQASAAGGRPKLEAAIRASNIPLLSDYTKKFDLANFPKGSTPTSIMVKLTDISEQDMGPLKGYGHITSGAGAVKAFTSVVSAAGKFLAETADNQEDARTYRKAYGDVASATPGYFKSANFKKLINISHRIAEDGDTERHTLLGQKKDGTWVALSYTDFPF